ncbi:helix-turn-helix DNA binding domain protein [Microbacterium phage Phinky]|nr:helix-turn-helix DNA binding domain protein [Microbacterium phage Phinky]
MSMRSEIRAALTNSEPMTTDEIVIEVHRIGTPWKATSIRQEVGRMRSAGIITNLDRHPKYGNVEHQPCRYELAS